MYQVSWTTFAKKRLHAILDLLPATNRNTIIEAARRIQSRLVDEGPNAGESRHGNFRIIFELPLVAYVWVGETDTGDTVTVIRILYRGKPQADQE